MEIIVTESSHCQQQRDAEGAKRTIKILFYIYSIGTSLVMSAYFALFSLQSSLNIEGNSGTISVATSYVVSGIFGIFCTPNFIRMVGSRSTLIIGELLLVVYVAGNYYPEMYVLIPCAVGSGISIAIIFPVFSAFNTKFAFAYSRYGSMDYDEYISNFQGKFYGMYLGSQIFGNLVSYVVLFSATNGHETPVVNNITTIVPLTTHTSFEQYISTHCGANDCQEQAVLDKLSGRYKPPRDSSVTILLTVMICIALLGITINIFVIPGWGKFDRCMNTIQSELNSAVLELQLQTSEAITDSNIIENVNYGFVHDNIDMNNNEDEKKHQEIDCNNNESQYDTKEEKPIDEIDFVPDNIDEDFNTKPIEPQNVQGETNVKFEKSTWSTIKSTFSIIFSWDQFIINGCLLHYGMMRAFVFSDLTRAYASCTVGVHLVGLCIAVNAVPSTVLSFIGGKLVKKFGRNSFISAATLLNLAMYTLCLLWKPNQEELVVIFLMFFGFGLCEGIWLPNTIVIMIERYKTKQDAAMSVWNVMFLLGAAVIFGLNSVLCVNEKLYLLIGLLVFSMLTYGISEYRIMRNKSLAEKRQNTDCVDVRVVKQRQL